MEAQEHHVRRGAQLQHVGTRCGWDSGPGGCGAQPPGPGPGSEHGHRRTGHPAHRTVFPGPPGPSPAPGTDPPEWPCDRFPAEPGKYRYPKPGTPPGSVEIPPASTTIFMESSYPSAAAEQQPILIALYYIIRMLFSLAQTAREYNRKKRQPERTSTPRNPSFFPAAAFPQRQKAALSGGLSLHILVSAQPVQQALRLPFQQRPGGREHLGGVGPGPRRCPGPHFQSCRRRGH